jgi:hypothetical protein
MSEAINDWIENGNRSPKRSSDLPEPIMRAIADAKEFVEAAATDGFDPNDALDLLREIADLATPATSS